MHWQWKCLRMILLPMLMKRRWRVARTQHKKTPVIVSHSFKRSDLSGQSRPNGSYRDYSLGTSAVEAHCKGGLETWTTTRTKQTSRTRLMCLSEVSLPVSVPPSWRAHTCFCSLWALRTKTSILFTFIYFSLTQLTFDTCLYGLWFWWKTPESEDSLISHTPNPSIGTTSCHYWKRKRHSVGHTQE